MRPRWLVHAQRTWLGSSPLHRADLALRGARPDALRADARLPRREQLQRGGAVVLLPLHVLLVHQPGRVLLEQQRSTLFRYRQFVQRNAFVVLLFESERLSLVRVLRWDCNPVFEALSRNLYGLPGLLPGVRVTAKSRVRRRIDTIR